VWLVAVLANCSLTARFVTANSQPNGVTDEQFLELRANWSEGAIAEILSVVAMFAFLNRWNDTMATPLEMRPVEVAQQALGALGWEVGKHG